MACLNESTLQGYIGEVGAGPLRPLVEDHLSSCPRCRSAFDRVAATNRRVNSWLAKLSPSTQAIDIDATGALAQVLNRITPDDHLGHLFAPIQGRGANPRAFVWSLMFQGAIVAVLLLAGATQVVRTPLTTMTLIAPPPPVKPIPHTSGVGGGGQQSPLPLLTDGPAKLTPIVFTPPLVTTEHPALTLDASLLAPPDAWAAPTSAIGNPLGVLGSSVGRGTRGGLGDGEGPGAGNGGNSGNGGDDVGIFTVGSGITKPVLISQADPEYSEEARKAKYSGTVILSIVVNTDGTADSIKVVKSLGMGLDEKAVEAVQKWRFKPGTNKGTPVRVKAQVEVNFRLL